MKSWRERATFLAITAWSTKPATAGFFIPVYAMNISHEAISSVGSKAVTVAPPAVVAGLNFAGITLPELVQMVTLAWLLILIVDKVWSLVLRWKKGKAEDEPT
jgi:hypothetical protein